MRHRRLGLHPLIGCHVAMVQTQLSERASQEEDTVVVAADAEAVEPVAADALARRLAVPVHENLRAPVVKDGRVDVPVAGAARAAEGHAPPRSVPRYAQAALGSLCGGGGGRRRAQAYVPRSECRGDESWPEAVMQISGAGCQPCG